MVKDPDANSLVTSIVATADVTKSVVESLQLIASKEATDVDVVAADATFVTTTISRR